MLLHPNVVFLAKRGISKPSSALPAPRTRSRIPVPWMVTSTCGKGSTWWGRCKELMGWVCKISMFCVLWLRLILHTQPAAGSIVTPSRKLNQGRSHALWLRLILLSRKGSAFCSTGLNDIYWINSWVRVWDNGGGYYDYSACSFLLFVPPNVSLWVEWGASLCM